MSGKPKMMPQRQSAGAQTGAAEPHQSALRTAMAGLIGNVLEWFDFAVYGYFASDIGQQFFPQEDRVAQQLLAFAVFALGFLARPVGGLVLGRVGDRIGRRPLLTISILMMGGATLILGLLPTYAQIGVAAPLLLLTMRLIQGFSLGGEYTGSMAYTTEKASPMMRGIVSSSTAVGTTLGFILGSGSAWIVNASMAKEAVTSWGWRIPFVASVVICVLGYYILRGVSETEAGKKAASIRPPVFSSLLADWLPCVQTFGIVGMTNAAYYLTFTYMVERRKAMGGASGADFLLANTLTLIIVLMSKPLGGWVSDRIGRRRLMLILTFATTVVVYFSVRMMLYGSATGFTVGQVLMAIPVGMALGMQGAMVVEIFPLRARVTSLSFAYSVTLALTGGMAPLISTWLIERLHQPLAPAFYIMTLGIIGLMVMVPMSETNKRILDE
jgi:MHS family proline/betaine transporter-like MFS transporter